MHLSQTTSLFHIQSLSVTDCLCLSLTVCVWLCITQTVVVYHRKSLYVTENMCMSHTVCVSHKNMCLSQTLCVFPRRLFWSHTVSVMSKYHKIHTNEYPNIFGCHIKYRTNIRIYLNATYLPNKYLNIFVLRIQHIYKSYLRVILLEYSNIHTHHCFKKKLFKRALSCFL